VADLVLVVGATGGVGQLAVAKLLEKGISVRVLTRSAEKAKKLFDDQVEAAIGDIRQPETLPSAMLGITHLICATGTTAFPSARWQFDLPEVSGLQKLQQWRKIFLDKGYRDAHAKNSPQIVDADGVRYVVEAAPHYLQRFVFVSSCGVEHKNQFPYTVLNAFGVLDAKQQGEAAIVQSGLPYTIVRPGQLIDGPFTSYDLNTLMKATTGGKKGITIGTGDTLSGQTSRIDVAAACVESLHNPNAVNKIFEMVNKGNRPEAIDWSELFASIA
jgi:uncharacterized protein YbjT (DUF2867 family)